jgi:hypothetical protein
MGSVPKATLGSVPSRPYVVLSAAVSADGYLDDASPQRLILSGPADLDRVDEVRASCDAIIVGAQTVRTDNPRLLIRASLPKTAMASLSAGSARLSRPRRWRARCLGRCTLCVPQPGSRAASPPPR